MHRGRNLLLVYILSAAGCTAGDPPVLSPDLAHHGGDLTANDSRRGDSSSQDLVTGDGQPADGPEPADTSISADGQGPVLDHAVQDQAPATDLPPPPNGTCANAARLVFPSGSTKVQANGTTGLPIFSNEYASEINCGSPLTMSGPQAYYKIELTAGQSYLVAAEAIYSDPRVYIFTGCGAMQINADCGSNGASGQISGEKMAAGVQISFTPSSTGDYFIAVDSTSAGGGPFVLSVEQKVPPPNHRCLGAYIQSLYSGPVTNQHNTAEGTNEYGDQIDCGTGVPLRGPQRYYKAPLEAGTYQISFSPQFDGYLYIFPAADYKAICASPSDIDQACSSGGSTGSVSPLVVKGQTYSTSLVVPQVSAYHIAVDSASPAESGDFTLTITPPL